MLLFIMHFDPSFLLLFPYFTLAFMQLSYDFYDFCIVNVQRRVHRRFYGWQEFLIDQFFLIAKGLRKIELHATIQIGVNLNYFILFKKNKRRNSRKIK